MKSVSKEVKEFIQESQDGSSSQGQGDVQNLEGSKNRSTDRQPNIHMQYKDSQRTQNISDEKYSIPPIFIYVKCFN